MQKTFLVALLCLFCLLSLSSCNKSSDDIIFELEYGDYTKNCIELNKEIKTLSSKYIPKEKRKILRGNIYNTVLYVASPFTFFTSLLLLQSNEEEKEKLDSYYVRLNHLYYLKELNGCPQTNE